MTKRREGQRCFHLGCKNFPVPPSLGCRLHGPEFKEQLAMYGKRRHKRFSKASLDGQTFDKAKIPTIAGLIDKFLEIEAGVSAGTIEPPAANARVAALKEARQALHIEREREDKYRFAWEQAQRRQGEGQDESSGSEREQPVSIAPPWMQPKQ